MNSERHRPPKASASFLAHFVKPVALTQQSKLLDTTQKLQLLFVSSLSFLIGGDGHFYLSTMRSGYKGNIGDPQDLVVSSPETHDIQTF